MAVNAIVFTADEVAVIKAVTTTSSVHWGCDELNSIRARIKEFYLRAQKLKCCYCRQPFPTTHGRAWDVEHVLAQSSHPEFMFEPENLAISCIDCNAAKRNQSVLTRPFRRFPRKSNAYSIVHPHYDDWNEHFVLGSVVYAPRTEKGARTIVVCQLFRFYQILGQDALFAQDRRCIELAERFLFASSAQDAEVAVLAISALTKQAVEAELNDDGMDEI